MGMVEVNSDDLTERWAAVVGSEGVYEISTFGRVRSLPRVVDRAGRPLTIPGKIMTHTLNQGYPRVTLRIAGETVYRMVHQLVAEAFIGPCPAGQEVRHKTSDRGNPRLDHIEYGTRLQNIFDTKAQGRFTNGVVHLTEEMVREIAGRHTDTARLLAAEFGVSMSTIAGIRNGTVWAHLGLPVVDHTRSGDLHPARRGMQKLPDKARFGPNSA